MKTRQAASLAALALTVLAALLAVTGHSTDVCMGEGSFDTLSVAVINTPEGNFTIYFEVTISIVNTDGGYNVSVLSRITNITGPPILLQARLPLFDFAVTTDNGEYRWSDGKVFAAVMTPVSSGLTYRMSLTGIKASCIKSVSVDVPGLGIPDIVSVASLKGTYYGPAMTQTYTRSPNGSPTIYTIITADTNTATSTEVSGGEVNALGGKAVFAGSGSTDEEMGGGVERNVIAAVIALLAAIGTGLLLYTLLT